MSTGNLGVGGGGGRGPFCREKEPPFRRKRLLKDPAELKTRRRCEIPLETQLLHTVCSLVLP